MDRRHFLAATPLGAAVAIVPLKAAPFQRPAPLPMRTRWKVMESEGFDAIAFLGALSGRDLYRYYYAADADAFALKLPAAIRADIPKLADEGDDSGFGLLWPVLANVLSGAVVTDLSSVIALLENLDARVKPAFDRNPSHEPKDYAWLKAQAPRLLRIFNAMRAADFAGFRRERIGTLPRDIDELGRQLARYDVVRWQEKLTGRTFDPQIEVVLLLFAKPHGAKMQGQTFLQAAGNDVPTTVRIAAHEMLHPPFPMDGPAAMAALAVLAKDPLIPRIVSDHDPKWGYTTLDGLLNEDVCEALDQLISEGLGVGRNPADRWRQADDGIHVIAAGLYGFLREDRWQETGGNIEEWLGRVVAAGRLAPAKFHPVAARVLERPVDRLWPLPA